MVPGEVAYVWNWIWANRDWLFSGIGLSISLVVAGIAWKFLIWFALLLRDLSSCAAGRVALLWVRLGSRRNAREQKDEAANPISVRDPQVAERPKLLKPSPADVATTDLAHREYELKMLGQTTGLGPYGYLYGPRDCRRMPSSPSPSVAKVRAKVSERGYSIVAQLLFTAAVINLIWVVVSALW